MIDTRYDKQVAALRKTGMGERLIGRELGITRDKVKRILDRIENHAQVKTAEIDPRISRLVRLTRNAPRSLVALADILDCSPKTVTDLVSEARDAGYDVQLSKTGEGVRPAPRESVALEQAKPAAVSGNEITIAAVGDVHFGNKFHMGAELQDFCDKAYAAGARRFLQVGDLLDGVYRHSVWDQTHRGFSDQSKLAVQKLPAYPDSTWEAIEGNHDETFARDCGLDVSRAVTLAFKDAGRKDFTMNPGRSHYFHLKPRKGRGVFVELWHPGKGPAYALSYKLQKKVEGYAVGQKPDILLVGHYHQSVYANIRGVHAFMVGCFQGGGSNFGKSLGTAPAIGSWIIRVSLTKDGTLRRVAPEWVGYYEREIVREVALG